MEETITPYQLPDTQNHSFFFVDRPIDPQLEAKLHQHDAWELLYVTHGCGRRFAGDSVHSFSKGDLVLIPPLMLHQWEFVEDSGTSEGRVSYLMVAFSDSLLTRCIQDFPELRNRLADIQYPVDALRFGHESAVSIGKMLSEMSSMDELGRLCEMLRLLPTIFGSVDHVSVGKPMRLDRDVRRMQQISVYVMRHYGHTISLDDIASELGMNRSAFCSYFKRIKGMTFSQFVTEYRLNTACDMLKNSQKQVSEICYLVGFNDLPHFIRVFTKTFGIPPLRYRKETL